MQLLKLIFFLIEIHVFISYAQNYTSLIMKIIVNIKMLNKIFIYRKTKRMTKENSVAIRFDQTMKIQQTIRSVF